MTVSLPELPDLRLSSLIATQEKFADETGYTLDQVKWLVRSGALPSIKIGKRRMINKALLLKILLSPPGEQLGPQGRSTGASPAPQQATAA